jgi:hypothetical protein
MKNLLLAEEMQNCNDIMFARISNAEDALPNYRQVSFESSDLFDVRQYIDRTIKKGYNNGYDYIHSPNCKYQDKNKIPAQIYAQALWDYYEWLQSFIHNEGIVLNSESIKEAETSTTTKQEPFNPYKTIFVNGWAYELFEKLREEIIVNPQKIYAGYSFIMRSMINDNYLIQTNHLKLIKFLDNKYSTKINLKYFQFKNFESQDNKNRYSRLNKLYKDKITTVL